MTGVRAASLDHLVLCVAEVPVTIAFYERVLGMEAREERPGKWSLHFGPNKISLQDAVASPTIAADTIPGTGNFCVLTSATVDEILDHLAREGVEIEDGPGERAGATGTVVSVYFRDPDGNLVEVSTPVTPT
jgi:catechol 2,3-dioxygenase-like lactoylglutathione lyase family enzyme